MVFICILDVLNQTYIPFFTIYLYYTLYFLLQEHDISNHSFILQMKNVQLRTLTLELLIPKQSYMQKIHLFTLVSMAWFNLVASNISRQTTKLRCKRCFRNTMDAQLPNQQGFAYYLCCKHLPLQMHTLYIQPRYFAFSTQHVVAVPFIMPLL